MRIVPLLRSSFQTKKPSSESVVDPACVRIHWCKPSSSRVPAAFLQHQSYSKKPYHPSMTLYCTVFTYNCHSAYQANGGTWMICLSFCTLTVHMYQSPKCLVWYNKYKYIYIFIHMQLISILHTIHGWCRPPACVSCSGPLDILLLNRWVLHSFTSFYMRSR